MIRVEEKENVGVRNLEGQVVSSFQVLKFLYFTIFCLSSVSLTASFIKYVVAPTSTNVVNILMTFFYFDKEKNIPTYFSSIILLVAAVLLGYIYLLKSRTKDDYYQYWGFLGLGFLFMSIDEYVGFHELLNLSLQERTELSGWFYNPWVIVGIGVVVMVGLLLYRFILNLKASIRRRFLLSGIIYVGGAIGVELLGGYITDYYGGRETFLYAAVSHVEEVLEMVGVSYFIYGLLSFLELYRKELNHLQNRQSP